MTINDIYKRLDTISPFELQESWDNSGLQIGSRDDEVKQIVLSIDLDNELIDSSDAGTLFIVHHPLIFGKLTALDFDTYPSNLIQKMIVKNQKLIAMHTNFDQTHLNRYVAEAVLGLTATSVETFIIYAQLEGTFDQVCDKVQTDLGLEQLKVIQGKQNIQTIALCTGSGASLIPEVKADLFLTGDIKYHDAMMAKSLNLAMIDIGHFESEHHFTHALKQELRDWPISVIISNSKNPFSYI
ncbi:MAG: Nif3-like dinuclear metal center hexameric protein [Thiovulaceae bacterium]|nr:Nif3-like dinuclear metal center hexameric protein [Sulfurimonadaceae bacterium]